MEIENVKMWVGDMEVEQAALEQIMNISQLPILAGHMAIMPDVHMGKGATVGSVIPTRNAIIPAAVGVDIGCGMCAVMTNLKAEDLPESLFAMRNQIERDVPVGFNEHSKGIPSVSGPYADVLRKTLRKDPTNKFVGMVCQNPDSVGKPGVSDKLPDDYSWSKQHRAGTERGVARFPIGAKSNG